MYLRITADAVELTEPHDVTAFHAECVAPLTSEELSDVLAREEVGELTSDGEHVFVRVDALRRRAAGTVGPSWEEDFSGMLAYAERKGWTSADGTAVRAHLVCPEA